MITHAGTVTFLRRSGQPYFLVVSSSDGGHWVLPKGHIQAGESEEMAALRELREEAGVIGKIIERLTIEEFETDKERITVQYFLVEEMDRGQPEESRIIRWENELSALRLLSFEGAKKALAQGAERIRKLPPEDSGR
jgi:bis(5'-nucleosidyl)-tetraphosphatase